MKKHLLIFFFLLGLAVSGVAQERHGPYKIHKFVDGDTFWVMVNPGKTEKIRLIGVDTPEVKWEGLTKEQLGEKKLGYLLND